jgi:hypothetical protein
VLGPSRFGPQLAAGVEQSTAKAVNQPPLFLLAATTVPSPRRAADAIYIRDGWRCVAPGCLSRRNLEDHHVIYRSRGGPNDLCNRICLCAFHHRQGEHGTLTLVTGTAPLENYWRIGVKAAGGRYLNEKRLR